MARSADRRIATLAAKQQGSFARAQALRCGHTPATIRSRLDAGRWRAAEPGIYVIAGAPETWLLLVVVACLATGASSAASHLTAAALWGLLEKRTVPVHVTVPHGRHAATRCGRIVHRARTFGRGDVRVLDGVRLTSPSRTLIDLAGLVDAVRLEATVDSALLARMVTIPRLRRYIEDRRLGRRKGVGRLVGLLDDRERGVPESELERIFLRLLLRFGLPQPDRQVRVGPSRIDFVYGRQRIIVEVDGHRWHGSRERFVSDRRRQNRLVLDGWQPLRFTWEDLTKRPDDLAALLSRALGVPLLPR